MSYLETANQIIDVYMIFEKYIPSIYINVALMKTKWEYDLNSKLNAPAQRNALLPCPSLIKE